MSETTAPTVGQQRRCSAFPIQTYRWMVQGHGLYQPAMNSIPWAMIAPHEQQAMANHGQSLDMLARRGGLCPSEALAVLDGRKWEGMPREIATLELTERVVTFLMQNDQI